MTFEVGKGYSTNNPLFDILDLQPGNRGSGIEHRLTTSNTVEALMHERATDPQADPFADVNSLAGDEATKGFNQADASCAKWLDGLVLSREASR